MTDKNAALLKTLEYPKILNILSENAATALGKDAVLSLVPQDDFDIVKQMLEETDEAFKILNNAASPPFGGMSNVAPQVKKAQLGGLLEPEDMSPIGRMLYSVRRMHDFFALLKESSPLLSAIASNLVPLTRLENEIENTISPNQTVRDEASAELTKIRREIKTNQARVKEKLENILNNSQYKKYFQDQLVTMRGDRYVIPVKVEYRQHFPGIVHDQSGSGATLFIEPLSVVEVNNDVKRLLSEEKEEVLRILKILSKNIAQNAVAILENIEVMTHLDVIFAKGKYAHTAKAYPPSINKEGLVNIEKGRHPLISADAVVPVDIKIGGDINTLIITGSNAGGKTVSLKIIGLFALMTQSGIFLPAGYGTTMPVFKDIYADIGDEQSIEQSLSTFSGQIKKLSEIVKKASKDSLVLLDEICAGTDPQEGAALAMAIIKTLSDNGAVTVLTTHYSQLKTFAFDTAGMQNASVEFDQVSLEPTYRLIMGLPGSSNAFHVAANLGLPKDIIKNAESFLDEEHLKMQNVLENLEAERKRYTEESSVLENLRKEAQILKDCIASQEKEISGKKREIIDKYRNEAAEAVRKARVDAEEAIKEIKALYNETSSKERQKAIENVRKKLVAPDFAEETVPEGQELTAQTAAIGKIVYIPSLRQKGTITDILGKEITVQIGSLKTNLPLAKCILTNEKPAPEVPKTGRRRAARELSKMTDFKSEIDVRGKTVEEAILDLDKYIDDAVLANAKQIRIIHGKGTGALRKGLMEYFNSHPSIRSHTMAAFNEGGSGATVLFL